MKLVYKKSDFTETLKSQLSITQQYNYNPNTPNDSSPTLGGISILVHSSVPHTICNIYIPPHTTPTEQHLANLIYQLATQFLFVRDFSAHHPIWGNPKQCPKGTLIENIILNNNISLLNNPLTYIQLQVGCLTSISLSVPQL